MISNDELNVKKPPKKRIASCIRMYEIPPMSMSRSVKLYAYKLCVI